MKPGTLALFEQGIIKGRLFFRKIVAKAADLLEGQDCQIARMKEKENGVKIFD